MQAAIRANYARLIRPFQSTEATRFYLCGFYIEPHPAGGALIVATDGHCLGCFYDQEASCDEAGIVGLTAETARACRPGKADAPRDRWLVVQGTPAAATARVSLAKSAAEALASDEALISQGTALVDGVFPDWRCVVPLEPRRVVADCFDARLLRRFELEDSKPSPITILSSKESKAALVVCGRTDFFGVIMPMRAPRRMVMPGWGLECAREAA